MSEVKKIGPHLLEDNLTYRLLKKIDMDDLDPELRTYIKNKNLNPEGYDDNELRTRIINIENKMRESTTDKDIKNLQDLVNNNTNAINNLEDKKIDKTEAQVLKQSIQFTDLDSLTQKKIHDAYSYYQSVLPGGSLSSDADLSSIITKINDMESNMATKTELANYETKDSTIPLSRLDAKSQNAINAISSLNTSSLIDAGYVSENYRNKNDKIKESDLDDALQNTINSVTSIASSQDSLIAKKIEGTKNDISNTIKSDFIGDLNGLIDDDTNVDDTNITLVELGKFSSTEDPRYSIKGGIGSTFDLYQQRQILRNVGSEKKPGGVDENYKIADILAWMYYDIIGDIGLLSDNFQEEVCKYSKDRNEKLNDPGYNGVAYQIFPIMDAIIYLCSRIKELETTINKINNKYYSKNTEKTPDAQQTTLPDRLLVNNKA